jgi:hypothetical protein
MHNHPLYFQKLYYGLQLKISSTRPRNHTLKWKIFAQEDIIVLSHNVASIELRSGVEMSSGVTIVSLMQQLKQIKLSIQNESVVETTDDIVISIQNNSNNDITIKAGDALCFLTYVNIWNTVNKIWE